MTEKEKMLSGQLYSAMDRQLVMERLHAKRLCHRSNNTDPVKFRARMRILQRLFRTDQELFYIEPQFYCDYGYNIKFGRNFYANHNCIILDENPVKMGNDVFLGTCVQICTVIHPTDPCHRRMGLEQARPVKIGDNVWIGSGAIVLPGVNIGSNTVIGAGSIVTRDIPPDVVALGNPCRVSRLLDPLK